MSILIARLLAGFGLASAAAAGAYYQRALTAGGALLAMLFGTVIIGFGGWAWSLTLGICFGLTALFAALKQQQQARQGPVVPDERRRDAVQVAANGTPLALLALAYGTLGQPPILLAAFAGVLATVSGDTWASDLGVFSRQRPRKITTGRPLPRGASGGITLFGTAISAGAGLLVGLLLLRFSAVSSPTPVGWWLVTAGLLSGLIGSLVDSLLNATIPDRHRLSSDLINLLSALAGGMIAMGYAMLALPALG
jgi:uncharacterized protein (TIGR00297 family)